MNTYGLKVLKLVALATVSCGSINALASSPEKHDGHESSDVEVGLSIGYTYLKEEKEEGATLHLHVMKKLTDEGFGQYFSYGVGVETIILKESHYGAMVTLAVNPWRDLILSVSPGIEWVKHEGEWESGYATHFEVTYLFEGPRFHYGPVLGYAKTQDAQHYTAGIHFGIPL